ncbi:MAG: AAA family ATPase [Candidatus Paceibacterota bacterium]
MKKIYIFRGPPSSGKGTITEVFLKTLDGKVAYIELDVFRWGFHLKNRAVPDVTIDEHELAYQNYLSVLENYLKNGSYTIVTEGLFSWSTPSPHGNMQDILTMCKKYGYSAHPILLFADKELLWERNTKREYFVPRQEFDELYDFVMQEKSDTETVIDVGNSSVEETVAKLRTL